MPRATASTAPEYPSATTPRLLILDGERRRRVPRVTSLESDFPTVMISIAAQHESWRKEVHRPATHTHKWWAQRLGSVFRGILVAAVASDAKDAERLFGSAARLPELVVFDPFAGSGTTAVEAVKLGARVIARDINPVAALVQRQAIQAWDETALLAAFAELERRVKSEIDALYVTEDGQRVLYYFWVAVARCPECSEECELFSSHVFAKHAYPRKYRSAQATCATCHEVVPVDALSEEAIVCSRDHRTSRAGPVRGQHVTCSRGHRARVVDALAGKPPIHRMYAKLVLDASGKRRYLSIDDFDRKLYTRASRLLRVREKELVLPVDALEDGYNTRQAIRWGYKNWRQFFNDRQLYALGNLGAAIRELDAEPAVREAMAALFSGCLEFNNMFCSYKGEGTGAVRHMFSHHILKPERTPLEAHPWGAPQSSGAFSTLFRSRLTRAADYKRNPHDTVVTKEGKAVRIHGLSEPLHRSVVTDWTSFASDAESIYISADDSATTDIPTGTVDLVITDPPFMDNVHYSELADFFHAWLRQLRPFDSYQQDVATTRLRGEVQSTSAIDFERAIGAVWNEAARVMKDDGLLAFTFHQTKSSGWVALMRALRNAGLVVRAIQPVKAEMSVSAPKAGATAPSNLDSVVVCRKKRHVSGEKPSTAHDLASMARDRLGSLATAGIQVGPTDIQSVVRASVLSLITWEADREVDELATAADREAARVMSELGAAV